MAPRVSVRLAALRRSASTVPSSPSALGVLPPALQQTAATVQLLRDVKSTLVAVDQAVHRESAWPNRVEEAAHKLERQSALGLGRTDEMEIAVYSPPLAGSRDLVTALLEDPLDSDEISHTALRERANGSAGAKNQPLRIRYGSSALVDAEGLVLPSTFLQNGRLAIREIPASTPPSTLFTTLLLSPLPILVIDNLRLFSAHPALDSVLPSLLRHPHLRLVINTISDLTTPTSPGSTSSSFESRVWSEIDRCVGGDKTVLDSLRPRVHAIGAKRAVRALDAWREGQNLAPGQGREEKIALFQHEFVGSQIDKLKADLVRASQPALASGPLPALPPQLSTTLFLAQLAVSSSSYDLLDLSFSLKDYAEAAADVRAEAQTAAAEFVKKAMVMPTRVGDVGGVTDAPRGVAEAAASGAKREVERVLKGMGRNIFSAVSNDRPEFDVAGAITKGWGGEGERALITSAAALQSSAQALSAPIDKLLHHPPSPALVSPLLLNSIPPPPSAAPLPTSLLLGPLVARRNKLLALGGPVEALYARAQNAALTASWTSAGSVIGGVAGYQGGLWEGPTAAGVGALSALLGVRWGLAKWDKAKRRFWRDWRRVEEGLEADLQTELTAAAHKYLLTRPLAAADGIEELVRRQTVKVEERRAEVEMLKARVADLKMGQVPFSLPPGYGHEHELR